MLFCAKMTHDHRIYNEAQLSMTTLRDVFMFLYVGDAMSYCVTLRRTVLTKAGLIDVKHTHRRAVCNSTGPLLICSTSRVSDINRISSALFITPLYNSIERGEMYC